MTKKIIIGIIASIVGISAIIIFALAIHTDKKSRQELESIDTVIASYDASESTRSNFYETSDEIVTEEIKTNSEPNKGVEENDGYRSNLDSTVSTGNNDDSGIDRFRDFTDEELAKAVLDMGLNGEDRERYLGDRYAEVQAYIDEYYQPEVPTYVYEEEVYVYQPDTGVYYGDNVLTPDAGVNYYNGIMETYYNMDMTPWLEYIYSLGYSGEYWVRADGVKMFGDYIIVAADYGQFPMGTVVQTSLGTGMVLDTGLGGYNWFDIAVNW